MGNHQHLGRRAPDAHPPYEFPAPEPHNSSMRIWITQYDSRLLSNGVPPGGGPPNQYNVVKTPTAPSAATRRYTLHLLARLNRDDYEWAGRTPSSATRAK